MKDTIERFHEDLQTARRHREQRTVETLQAVLTRITNAEAVPVDQRHISIDGVGASEVPRRILTDAEIQTVIHEELTELHEAHASMAAHPEHAYAAELAQKIAILSRYTTA
jgi:uncharacterized protein YqeY